MYLKLNILNVYIGLIFFVIYRSQKHLSEDGHTKWPKHVGGIQRLQCNKFTYFHMHLVGFILIVIGGHVLAVL